MGDYNGYRRVELDLGSVGVELDFPPVYHDKSPIKSLPQLFTEQDQDIIESNSSVISITADPNNIYSIFSEMLESTDHQVIMDGDFKVADIIIENGKIIVKSYTDKQINFSSDIEAESLLIESQGPVCFTGKIHAEHMEYAVKALTFTGDLVCSGIINCKSQQGVAILGDVRTESLKIDAAYLHQSGVVRAENYSIITQAVKQTDSAKTAANNFSVVTEQCELYGDLTVDNGKCFITANSLWLGDGYTQNLISLTSEHYIHTNYCKLSNAAQLDLGQESAPSKNNRFIIDDVFALDKDTFCDLRSTNISAKTMVTKGTLTTDDTAIDVEEIHQSGAVDSKKTKFNISEEFNQSIQSKTAIDSSEFTCKRSRIHGDFSLEDTAFTGQEFDIFSGNCSIKNCDDVYVEKQLQIFSNAATVISKSNVEIGKNLTSNGVLTLDSSSVTTEDMGVTKQQLNLVKSKLTIVKRGAIHEGLKALDSEINSSTLLLTGESDINNLVLHVDEAMTFDSDKSTINRCRGSIKNLTLRGSKEKNKVVFQQCNLSVKALNQSKHITLDTTNIYGIDPQVSHYISEELEFQASGFATRGQVHVASKGRIVLKDFSIMKAGMLWQEGDIENQRSQLIPAQLFKQGGELSSTNGVVSIEGDFISTGGSSKFSDQSTVQATNIYHKSGAIRLKNNGFLNVAQEIITGESSEVSAELSKIKAGQFSAVGAIKLKQSLLGADEIAIYNSLTVDHSTILAQKRVQLTKTSDAKINNSTLVSKEISTLGDMLLASSTLHATETFRAYNGSHTIVEGKTVVKSDGNVLLEGNLEVKASIKDDGIKEIPALIVKDTLATGHDSLIKGNDLMIEATTFDHYGDISLSDSLATRGGVFSNWGGVQASSIFMGFDQAVVNYGSLSGKSITCHSNLFNLTGRIYAEQNFNCSGFVAMNLGGLIMANNASIDSLLSVNAGLILPNLSADLSYIFSSRNLTSFGRNIVSTLLPSYKTAIDLACTLPGLFSSVSSMAQKISSTDLKKLSSMRMHEIMPTLCQFKGVALSAYGTLGMTASLPGELGKTSFALPKFDDISWGSLGYGAASLFGGSYTDNSLLHANMGGCLALNTNVSSALHVNTGVERSAFSHNVSTQRLINTGHTGGRRAAFIAAKIDNHGKIEGSHGLYVKADELHNKDEIKGNGAVVDVKKIDQDGKLTLSEGQLSYETLNDSAKAETSLKKMCVKGNKLDVKGKFTTDQVAGEIKEVHFEKGAEEHLTDTSIKADNITDESQMTVSGRVLFETNHYKHAEGAKIIHEPLPNEVKIQEIAEAVLKTTAESVVEKIAEKKDELIKSAVEVITEKKDELIKSAVEVITEKKDNLIKSAVDIITEQKDEIIASAAASIHKAFAETDKAQKQEAPEQKGPREIFQVVATTAELNGSGNVANAYYSIDSFKDAAAFLGGTSHYDQYQFGNELTVVTKDEIIVNESTRQCGLVAQGSSVTWNAKHTSHQHLGLISTTGDVKVTKDIAASDFYVDSAADFATNCTITAESTLSVQAKGKAYNLGGTLKGDRVSVKAASVYNITKGSALGQQPSDLPVGDAGVIYGREVFVQSTSGNIENHGGIIRGTEYAQLTSTENVLNLCNQRTVQGAYDTITVYDPGIIAGGNGANTDGVGLHVKADGKVISDSSSFASIGSNYIEGVQGVEFKARSCTYISDVTHKKKHWGFTETTKVTTSTSVYGSTVQSEQGRNIIRSGEGEVVSTATQFVSPAGTDIYAKQDVKLFGLKTEDHTFKSTSHYWGLTSYETDSYRQQSTPTLFYDNGLTRVHSAEGNVDARGALFIGEGDLEIKAAKRVKFGAPTLDHSDYTKTRTVGVSAFGVPACQSYNAGAGAWGAVATTDSTLAKLDTLMKSNSGAEGAVNLSNLAIEAFNTTNSMMRGVANGNVGAEALSRYGLGGEQGFSPSVNVSLTETRTSSHTQTQGAGGVDRRNVKITAGEGVDLENGVRVHARETMDVDSPEIIAHSAVLRSSSTTETKSINVGVTASGDVVDVGGSYSKSSSKTTHYVNAELSSGGNMKLHHGDGAMNKVSLEGANIKAQSLDAEIKHITIVDQQDETKTKTTSVSASTSGQVSGYHGEGSSKKVEQSSGIEITDGLNTNGHVFKADVVDMTGGKITTAGENRAEIGTLNATALHDTATYTGFGVSLNLKDLQRLNGQQPTNRVGEQAIASAHVTVDVERYDATRNPVMFSVGANNAYIKQVSGNLHTTSADGVVVDRDIKFHATLDVPITNGEYLDKAAENIEQGGAIVAEQIKEKYEEAKTVVTEFVEGLIGPQQTTDGAGYEGPAGPKDIPEEDAPVDSKNPRSRKKKQSLDSEAKKKKSVDEKLDEIKQLQKKPNTPQNRKKLEQAIIAIYQAGGEAALDKVVDLLGKGFKPTIHKLMTDPNARGTASAIAFLKGKGLLFSVIMNIISEGVKEPQKDKKAQVVDGAKATVKQVGVGLAVKIFTGSASGPVSAAMTFMQIADIGYNQAAVAQMRSSAEQHRRDAEAQRQKIKSGNGTFSDYMGMWMSFDQANHIQKQADILDINHAFVQKIS